LPQQFEIGKAHLPRRRPRHGSTRWAENRRPQARRSAAHQAADGIGRLFGVAANHRSNERHCASHWQVKLAAEKRWKCQFYRTILPFATETRLDGAAWYANRIIPASPIGSLCE